MQTAIMIYEAQKENPEFIEHKGKKSIFLCEKTELWHILFSITFLMFVFVFLEDSKILLIFFGLLLSLIISFSLSLYNV